MTGVASLAMWYDRADDVDRNEGLLAYARYNLLLRRLSAKYPFPLERVVAAFVSLSPNNDYIGNLRSLVSVMEGAANGVPREQIVISTYNHCRDRAYDYLTGVTHFEQNNTGLKVLNFYHNILTPDDPKWVTIDGHMVAMYRGDDGLKMKGAIPLKSEYREIKATMQRMARRRKLIPCQLQATLWFARKRVLNIKYNPQRSLLHDHNDAWRTLWKPEDIKPFNYRLTTV